jgi:hypothetical protein
MRLELLATWQVLSELMVLLRLLLVELAQLPLANS